MFHYTIKSIALPGDLSTPVSTYLKVRDLFAQSALMESSDYHGSENNRSFIGLEPLASFSVSHGKAIMLYPDKTEHQVDITDSYSVSDAFDDFIKMFSVEGNDSAYCGLYGYTSFNAVRYFEHIDVKDSKEAKNDAPDIHYIMYKYLLVFNDFSSELKLLEMLADGESSRADEIVRAVMSRNYATYTFHAVGPTTSPLTDEEHKANIRRGIAHCKRGDVFQIVLSRRFIQHYEGDDFELYRALRRINPSPYLFYFDFGGFRIFGSSPETHCRIEDNGMAYIDPIAGTTRRQGNTEADAKAAAALLADPKENAEHTMLVDLARNDLNRHCTEVEVEFLKDTQFYSHVIHLVSRVRGRVRPGTNAIKLLADTFPAGTLSGAPKVRALQLISQYEPHNRGAYGGCIGFIGLNGTLNQAITIRSFVSRNGELWFQAGGGIVAASDEEYELQEVNNKLGALRKAIDMAEHASTQTK
ncbi:anthranilate synthase component I family protein [Prevotellamassilia timonensis]|jgi:anthranilate synthase component 1|uniref:anthranilate synthase component I family protein n=1 Tax=Prevotellamassilia timonensis TaxID=1852370 RepID=UPI00307F2F3B